MADKKITQLPASTVPLAGTEVLPIAQGTTPTTKQVSVANLTAGRAVSATQYISTIPTGTAPLVVTSTTEVANLKAATATLADSVKSNATTGVLHVTGPAAASTRVMTTPDANFTVARTDATNLFTADQTLATGNLVIGTSGKGIDFSATAGTGTSELLNDYEEGEWTATISDGTTDATMLGTRRVGRYTKVGRQVTVTNYVATTDMTGVTGNLRIKGLPFTVGNTTVAGGCVGFCDTSMTFLLGQVMILQTIDGVDYITIRYWNGAAGTVAMPGTLWGTNGEIGFTLTYFV